MTFTEWDDDHDPDGVLLPNIAKVEADIIASVASRPPLAWPLALVWHHDIHQGVPVPADYMLGNVRDSDLTMPELNGREIHVGRYNGTLAKDVLDELDKFETLGAGLLGQVDARVPGDVQKKQDLLDLGDLAGILHGEWVRIHPFAGGNGRTARCWVDWAAARYGVHHLLPIKPRPTSNLDAAYADYEKATRPSMRGDHAPFRAWLQRLLLDRFGM